MTDGLLNPWDTAPASALPRAGTLEHAAYEFFTGVPGVYIPAILVLGVSVTLFVRWCKVTRAFVPFVIRFGVTNIAFVCVSWLANPLVSRVEYRLLGALRVPFDYGFYRNYISILFQVLLLIALFWVQSRLVRDVSTP